MRTRVVRLVKASQRKIGHAHESSDRLGALREAAPERLGRLKPPRNLWFSSPELSSARQLFANSRGRFL